VLPPAPAPAAPLPTPPLAPTPPVALPLTPAVPLAPTPAAPLTPAPPAPAPAPPPLGPAEPLAAAPPLPEPAAAPRGHGDEVGAERVGLDDDFARRTAESDHRFNGHAFELGLGRLQVLASIELDAFHFLTRIGHQPAVFGDALARDRRDVEQANGRAVAAGHVRDERQHGLRRVAQVERHQDTLGHQDHLLALFRRQCVGHGFFRNPRGPPRDLNHGGVP